MNLIKNISYSVASAALILPVSVFAQIKNPDNTGLPSGSITEIITNLMRWLLMMVGIFGVIGFVISGILYLTSTGDQTMIDRAKKAMLYSIVGVLVALLGLVIFAAMQKLLTGGGEF